MSSIFNALNNNNISSFGPFGNMANLINRFNQFKSTFQGDPKQQVQQLLNSGQMSQQQFNQFQAMATQLQNTLR